MSALRLGLVGCGIAMQQLHYPALIELGDMFSVAGVTSRTHESAGKCAELFGTEEYDYDELLKKVDAVDIAVPTQMNYELVKKAFDAGVNVICEKPIAENVERGKMIVKMAERAEAVLYIAENYRHSVMFTKAKEMMNMIGKPGFMLYSKFEAMGKDNKYANTDWRKKPAHIGGFLSDGGVHDIAAIRMLMGDVRDVSAFVSRTKEYLGSYDTMAVALSFASGAIGSYSVSYGMSGENVVFVSGTDGHMSIKDEEITIEKSEEVQRIHVKNENTYKREFLDFYDVLKGKKNTLGSPEEALKDLQVIDEALRSATL
jgi:predicted dehydrogenase